jgi:hypothetical protein|tara:strand:+ start:441 stop:563 length:123 start_codon:yes stop_codon:yes gene_type:complete
MHINYDSDEDINKIQELLITYYEHRDMQLHEWWEEDDDDV